MRTSGSEVRGGHRSTSVLTAALLGFLAATAVFTVLGATYHTRHAQHRDSGATDAFGRADALSSGFRSSQPHLSLHDSSSGHSSSRSNIARGAADGASGGGGGGDSGDPRECVMSRAEYDLMMGRGSLGTELWPFMDWVHKHVGESVGKRYPSMSSLMLQLHPELAAAGKTVYDDFIAPADLPEVEYRDSQVRQESIAALKSLYGDGPVRFMVEVGSFIGDSASIWGPFVAAQGDTWAGDKLTAVEAGFRPFLAHRNGAPRLYERFLGRMVKEGLTGAVLPLRLSAVPAARIMMYLKYKIDVLYMDTGNEWGETFLELSVLWECLRPGGVLLGDDYDATWWPAVVHDVDKFAAVRGLAVVRLGSLWGIKKPEKPLIGWKIHEQ